MTALCGIVTLQRPRLPLGALARGVNVEKISPLWPDVPRSVGLGIVLGWLLLAIFGAQETTIAMSWGDGKYGKEFYGAQVYLVPDGSEYSVRARILIGPDNGYYHDCEEIGRVTTVQEGVDRFGKIRWEEKGLSIGDPAAGGMFLPRVRLESHR
jgi:hypothetical protein